MSLHAEQFETVLVKSVILPVDHWDSRPVRPQTWSCQVGDKIIWDRGGLAMHASNNQTGTLSRGTLRERQILQDPTETVKPQPEKL